MRFQSSHLSLGVVLSSLLGSTLAQIAAHHERYDIDVMDSAPIARDLLFDTEPHLEARQKWGGGTKVLKKNLGKQLGNVIKKKQARTKAAGKFLKGPSDASKKLSDTARKVADALKKAKKGKSKGRKSPVKVKKQKKINGLKHAGRSKNKSVRRRSPAN